MFQNLTLFQTASAMARHAGARQAILAQNVANADTPGYKARDVTPFVDIVSAPTQHLRATRAAHLNAGDTAKDPQMQIVRTGADSPNGNAVSVEDEMMKAVDTMRQHDRALAIYKSTLGILRTSLGRR